MSDFGNMLRELRESRNMMQADVAKAAGIPASAVSHFERGHRRPSLHNLARLTEAMFLNASELRELVATAHLEPRKP